MFSCFYILPCIVACHTAQGECFYDYYSILTKKLLQDTVTIRLR